MAPQAYNKSKKSRKGLFFGMSLSACAVLVVAVCIALNVSAAGADSTNASTLGLTETSTPFFATSGEVFDLSAGESSILTTPANRNIDQAINEMLAIEAEEARIAEEKRLAEEAAKQAKIEELQSRADADAALVGVGAVDWSVGHDSFVAHWTDRINKYLAGSPLSGYGATFAEAAWDNGIDPRLSPAISNTESTKGANCFLPYNAWGWGRSSWGNWEDAIKGHISGLAAGGYGPMITYSGAKRYCPPTYDSWFKNTVAELKKI